jgi:hypothetical protein
MKFPIKSLIAIGVFVLAGCSNDDAATIVPVEQAPTVFAKVQALHASPDAPLVNVMVDGAVIATADYMDASAEGAGPPGTHSISVDAIMPGDDVFIELFAGMDEPLEADTVTTVIVSGPVDELVANVYVQPDNVGDDAVGPGSARVFLVHADANVGVVDVYVTAPDADLAASAPLGDGLAYEMSAVPAEFAAGVYEVSVTAGGGELIFNAFATLNDGDDLTVVIVPNVQEPDFGGSPIVLVAMDANGAGELNDANALALISVTHMSPDAGLVDLVEADDGLIWTADYLDTTGVCDIDAGDYSFSVESEGTAVLEGDLSFDAAIYSTVIVDGLFAADDLAPDGLALSVLHDDNRSVASYSKQRFYHGSPSIDDIGEVDIYVVPTGDPIADLDPTVEAVSFRDSTGYLIFDEGNYDIIVTATDDLTKTPLVIVENYMFGNENVETHMIGDDPAGGTDYAVVPFVEGVNSCLVGG